LKPTYFSAFWPNKNPDFVPYKISTKSRMKNYIDLAACTMPEVQPKD
jgi:hypothetical protein